MSCVATENKKKWNISYAALYILSIHIATSLSNAFAFVLWAGEVFTYIYCNA